MINYRLSIADIIFDANFDFEFVLPSVKRYKNFIIQDSLKSADFQVFIRKKKITDNQDFSNNHSESSHKYVYDGNQLLMTLHFNNNQKIVDVIINQDISSDRIQNLVTLSICLSYKYMGIMYFCALQLHSSTVVYEGNAYAFIGRSGIGKSTHSKQWIDNISGTILLNDDGPIVRIIDGKAFIFGSPWSGKKECYKNLGFPLKAIVKINRGAQNIIKKNTILQSLSVLTPCFFKQTVDDESVSLSNEFIIELAKICHTYSLLCLPTPEAAIVCSKAIVAFDDNNR